MPVRKKSNTNFVAEQPKHGWAYFEKTGHWRRTPEPWGAPRDHFPREYGDWFAVKRPRDWQPPTDAQGGPVTGVALRDGGTSLNAAEGGGSGGGMKIGAGHKPQPYGWHGYYGETDGGSSSGPEHRGKVTLPHEMRGKVTPPAQKGTVGQPPPAPQKSPLGQGPKRGQDVGKHYVLPPAVKAENAQTSLVYSQSDGRLMDMEDRLVGQGYSGAPGHVNKPEFQDKVDKGVIPEGSYTVGEVIVNRTDARGMGPDVIKLEPDPATAERIRAMGRDPNTFYVHGDNGQRNGTASQGCIIMDKDVRKALKELQGAKIRVVR
jgi:hypothetical protein